MCASEQEFDEVAAITALINQGSSGAEDGEEAADEAPIESSSIDSIVRGRLMLLDAVNEVLSKRVMDNYSDFVNGMSKVSELEEDLEMTSSVAQSCRHHLSLASAQVSLGLQIAQQTKTKRTIINMIQMLVNMGREYDTRLSSSQLRRRRCLKKREKSQSGRPVPFPRASTALVHQRSACPWPWTWT